MITIQRLAGFLDELCYSLPFFSSKGIGDKELLLLQNEIKRSSVFNFLASLYVKPASIGKKILFCSGIHLLACFEAEPPYVAQAALQRTHYLPASTSWVLGLLLCTTIQTRMSPTEFLFHNA